MANNAAKTIIKPDDLTFLVELRDYLNSAASPATGGTIAFSTFVSDRRAGHRTADAREAYPGYERLARRLRFFVNAISFLSLVVTVLLAGLAAYVYWGNAIVSAAAIVYTQQADLSKDIQREEATGESSLTMLKPPSNVSDAQDVRFVSGSPSSSDPKDTRLLPLCDAVIATSYNSKPTTIYQTATQEYLCTQETVLTSQISEFNDEILAWQQFLPKSLLPEQFRKVPDERLQTAPHLLSMINGYAIPLLMGFLGSSAFVLRSFLKRLGDRVLTTRDIQANAVRIVLGILSGLAVGFFLGPSGGGSSPTNTLGMGISLTAPALSFLAGYAVEVLFKFLDTIAGQAFVVK